jgi:hypothetical protein
MVDGVRSSSYAALYSPFLFGKAKPPVRESPVAPLPSILYPPSTNEKRPVSQNTGRFSLPSLPKTAAHPQPVVEPQFGQE